MKVRVLFTLAIAIVASAWNAMAAGPDFNRDIRPILSENCFYCHGRDPNHRKAGLQLDQRESVTRAAESGDVPIVPGNPNKSSLIGRIESNDADLQMPPPKTGHVLTTAQKRIIRQWIEAGAEYQPHWAYVAPLRTVPPKVARGNWPRNAIDTFVLAKMEEANLSPSPEADRPTLIRRLYFDLVGLPPTPEEVDDFVLDNSPLAYEKLVDRLLNSEHYGERMALPWLDAARYADSNGFQQDGDTYQWVWRDWVVKALNADMPFDQFSILQLAGDLLPGATDDQRVATAFNRNHLLNGEGGAIPEEQRFNGLFDRVDTTATTWLGLTVACAQCHDHKYDPITQRDYYSLMAAFNNVPENGLVPGVPGAIRVANPVLEYPTAENKRELAAFASRIKAFEESSQSKAKFALALAAWTSGLTSDSKTVLDSKTTGKSLPENVKSLLKIAPDKRTDAQKKELAKSLRTVFERSVWPSVLMADASLNALNNEQNALKKYTSDEVPRVMVMSDDRPRETFILDRGNYEKPKDKVAFNTPGFLPPMPKDFPRNRLGFARWLFLPENPLTARVQVNRMWQLFLGAGLVKTAEDMGVQSEYPLERELLDWLAVEFRESHWSAKHIHRLIVTSATYRQASRISRESLARDPENRYWARGARFRMPAMILRDAALAASGLVNARLGGKPVYPYQPEGVWDGLAITKERDFTYPTSTGSDLYRRSLYTFWRRTVSPANMFDASTRQTCKVRQSITCTPLHALTTLNDTTWAEAARVLAQHAMESSEDDDTRERFAFRRVLGRVPTAKELMALAGALEHQRTIYRADPAAAAKVVSIGNAAKSPKLSAVDHAAYTALCLAILNLDEALTRE